MVLFGRPGISISPVSHRIVSIKSSSLFKGEVVHVKLVKAPSYSLLNVPRRYFCCGSLLLVFGIRVLVTCHLTCVHINFSLVLLAEWPPFGK